MRKESCWANRYSILSEEECTLNSNKTNPISSELMPENSPSRDTNPKGTKYFVRTIGRMSKEIWLDTELQTVDTCDKLMTRALLDSGATGLFVNKRFVEENRLNARRLKPAIPVYNVDGTLNEGGSITHEIDFIVRFKDHTERATFEVCELGKTNVILGDAWLHKHNPEIDWRTGEISMTRCPRECRVKKNVQARERRARRLQEKNLEKDTPTINAKQDEPFQPDKGDRLFMVRLLPKRDIYAVIPPSVSAQLTEGARRSQLQALNDSRIPVWCQEFKQVFAKESFDQLPPRKPWDHAVELKPGSEPVSHKIYPLSQPEQEELDKFLEENLRTGRIRPSKSPMAAPVFFVKKKDGSLRLVQDYRKLNDMTIKNRYPLPLISELINKLKGARFFTKLDVRWGYNNVRIKEGDEWKAAFRTNRGLFEPLVMFFGLTNSPATFQTMMDELFRDLIHQGKVVIYIDDILIFTRTREEHRQIVKQVLQILKDNNLYLKPEKCVFEQTEVEFLGLVVSEDSVKVDPVKVEGVKKWPTPTNVKELQSFLGFTNFYRRFIEDFSHVAAPLHKLTNKEVTWSWGSAEQEAFEEIKNKLISAPVLMIPQDDGLLKVEADASNFATGAVISQMGSDNKWHPLGFMSKSLNETERNYDIYDREMLAVIRALGEWRHLLEGATQPFEIWTDHRNLEYFKTAQKLNRRQARWSLFLTRFSFTLHHRPGKYSGKPDALSRRAGHERGENDNDGVTLLKPEFFKINANKRGHAVITGAERSLLRKIRESKEFDEPVVKAAEELKKSAGDRIIGDEWAEEQGLILFKGKVYVPKDLELRTEIIKLHHDSPIAGHPGRWKTAELVSRNYWWPGLHRSIVAYIKDCDECNQTKTFPSRPIGKLTPTEIPSKPWQIITIDFITKLPEGQGYDSIMVVIDRFSKMGHFIPIQESITSEGVAKLFRDHIWRLHGLPEKIISDRGTQFVSKFMRELNRLLGIKTSASTAYHPQTDGQTERVNQEIEQYLRLFVNDHQDNWMDWLPTCEFSYNNRIHSSTHFSPFMINNGMNPRLGTEPVTETKLQAVEDFITRMNKVREETESALKHAAEDMKRFYDINHGDDIEYNVGDQVWLNAEKIKTGRPSKKLDVKRLGPYRISEKVGNNAYRLKLPANMRIHPVFHASRLMPYTGSKQRAPPGPTIVDGNDEWDVEKIMDSRVKDGQLEYLVHWEGYPHEEDTWEPVDNVLPNSKKLVNEFHRRNPSAPRRISKMDFDALAFRPYANYTEFTDDELERIQRDILASKDGCQRSPI